MKAYLGGLSLLPHGYDWTYNPCFANLMMIGSYLNAKIM